MEPGADCLETSENAREGKKVHCRRSIGEKKSKRWKSASAPQNRRRHDERLYQKEPLGLEILMCIVVEYNKYIFALVKILVFYFTYF